MHEAGLRVDTTLDLDLQQAANRAVADGVAAYERRHGWKGKLENVLAGDATLDTYRHPDWAVAAGPGDYIHALVTRALPLEIHARIGPPGQAGSDIVLLPADWQWTGVHYGDALAKPGDILYVRLAAATEGGARRASLEQDSGAEGALLAMDNTSGDVLAMVGGRDYALSVFNRATQAERQTGSSFKPYVYTAAVEDGVKPTDIIVDGPVSFGGYVPHNYENDYKGAMTIANAFAESRNIPALKLAARVGIHKVIDMAHRFGVTSNIPAYLPVALGAVEITLEEQVASYSVFPNDGIRVAPRLIRKVSNADGITLWQDTPAVNEVIDQQTARTMMTLLRGVTAARHRRLGRAVESSARRQNRNHLGLYRRLVFGILAFGHLRRVGGLRQPRIAGQQGNRRGGRAAHLDQLHARRHRRQRRRAVPRRRRCEADAAGRRPARLPCPKGQSASEVTKQCKVTGRACIGSHLLSLSQMQAGSRMIAQNFQFLL